MKSLFIPAVLMIAPLHAQDLFRTIFPAGASRLDSDVDGLYSSDIEVTSLTSRFQQQRGKNTYQLGFGRTYHDVNYEPAAGTFTLPSNVEEDSFNFEFGIQHALRNDLQLNFSATYTDGISDHRSLWIAEFNRQAFGFFPSFEEPDPLSFSFSTGFDWDVSSSQRFVASYSFSRARIVSGNAIDPVTFSDVAIGDPYLNTHSGTLSWESTLNRRIRTQQTLQISRTEAREVRLQFRTDWALALSDKFTVRLQGGVATEDPVFDAYFGGVVLVYELSPKWQFDLGYRVYDDTGEINSSNFNNAAPGLQSSEISVSALYRSGDLSIRGSLGLFDTDFDEITNPENTVFGELFRDREFLTARIAISRTF